MFDTHQTEFKITSPDVPFSQDPRANVVAAVFDAFRAQGFGIGAYFSKPDWHSPDYWRPDRFAHDRNPNYDVAADPERWARFVKFVHAQIKELVTGYGKIDILWLDGGWVRPPKQDIRMAEIVSMARGYQPDLIVVNRGDGEFEDYTTPEQEVPDKPLLEHPWESCLTMGTQWSYKPDDDYKSTRQLIHLLVDIVAKGGNLLLNVGPRPDGTLPPTAVSRLSEMGDWMAINSEAIYATKPIPPYRVGNVALTQRGPSTYITYLAPEGAQAVPAMITIPSFQPRTSAKATLLGSSAKVTWRLRGADTVLEVSSAATQSPPCRYAFVFKLSDEA
jgi:alpha-L-fucosidase